MALAALKSKGTVVKLHWFTTVPFLIPILTREQIIFRLQRFRTFDPKNPKHRKNMIDSFFNAIVLYDDKIIFYFNYKENAKTLYQKDLEDYSDIFDSAPPQQDHTVDTMSAVWLFYS